MTAACVGFLPASSSPLIMRSAPAQASYCPKLGEVALGEVRILLHCGLHLLGSRVRENPGTVERDEVVTLQGAPSRGVDHVRLVPGGEEYRLQLHSGLLQCFRQGVVGIVVQRWHERVHVVLLGNEGIGREVDSTQGNRGIQYAHLHAQVGRGLCVTLCGPSGGRRDAVPVGAEHRPAMRLQDGVDLRVGRVLRVHAAFVGSEHVRVGLGPPFGAIGKGAGHGYPGLLRIFRRKEHQDALGHDADHPLRDWHLAPRSRSRKDSSDRQ